MVETSIYITNHRYNKLLAAANEMNTPIVEILSRLLMKSRYLFRDYANLKRLVRYQKNYKDDKFHIMNIRLNRTDYEYAIGQRLLFKFSVSLIFRLSIDLFLSLIVEQGMGSDQSDDKNFIAANYRPLTYCVLNKDTFEAEFWILRWDKRKRKSEKQS